VARIAADEDVVAAPAGERIAHRDQRIERGSALIERDHRDIGAELDDA